jgi:enoyl-CoA hydratase
VSATFEIDDGIGRIVLGGAAVPRLAAPAFADPDALDAFLARDDLRGVVVAGAGRHFCGGADTEALSEALRDPVALGHALDRGKALLARLAAAPVPVVAAIRGQCLGAGLEIALACDFRIAADGAMFGFPEAGLGLLPGLGGTVPDLPRLARRTLVDLVVSARLIGASEALESGLVDAVVPASEVGEAAAARVRTLVEGRPTALVRAILQSIRNGRSLPRQQALRRETELFIALAAGRGPEAEDGA